MRFRTLLKQLDGAIKRVQQNINFAEEHGKTKFWIEHARYWREKERALKANKKIIELLEKNYEEE